MTLAVIVDDAAGNRGAAFRDFDYTAAADLPNVLVALTEETDGTSSLHGFRRRHRAKSQRRADFPLSHDLAYADGTLCPCRRRSSNRATSINRETMAVENAWNSAQSAGSLPLDSSECTPWDCKPGSPSSTPEALASDQSSRRIAAF